MTTKRLAHYLFILVVVLNQSCANRLPPSGGPKDETPPVILSASPENYTTSFTSTKIMLTFDEYIQLNDAFTQIVVSPPLTEQARFKIKGKKLLIELNNELLPNTTYSINFGDAIRDFNEGNILKNFTYVFSTGKWLDSLKISGKIIYAFDNTPAKDVLALLYKNKSDTAILTERPFYFTKTDKEGNFTITNIGAGEYKVYALKDVNLNYLYDSQEELIGFNNESINISDSTETNILLSLFSEEIKNIKLLEVNSKIPGKTQFVFNTGLRTVKIDSDIFNEGDLAALNKSHDTLTYWTSNFTAEKAVFYITMNDSLLDTIETDLPFISIDSIYNDEYLLNIKKRKKRKKSSENELIEKNLFDKIQILINRPINSIDLTRIIILEDTTESKIIAKTTLTGALKNTLIIDYQWSSGMKYKIIIPDSTLQDIFGLYNQPLFYEFKVKTKDNYGTIILNILSADSYNNYVIELYNGTGKLLNEKSIFNITDTTLHFYNYLAGSYTLRIFNDVNKNGVWDIGEYLSKRQPEKVVTYRKNMTLKANWEMELDLKL